MTAEEQLQLKINPEYQDLIDPLTKDEYTSLKNSIKENGQRLLIIVNSERVIIDGHHRYRVCQELGITPKIKVREFSDQADEKQFIHDCNVERRHLNTFQLIKLKLQRRKSKLQEQVKQNESLGGKGDKILTPLGRVNEVIGKEAGASRTQVSHVEYLLNNASQGTQNKLEGGKITIDKAFRELKKHEKRAELIQEALNSPKIDLPEGFRLIPGDFREKSQEIADESVNLIFTDPPYAKEYLYIYGELAKVADRVLKSGGSLIAYAGCFNLPDVINQVLDNSASLKWNWQLIMLHTGPTEAMHGPKVFVRYKPLLWFVKARNGAPEFIVDVIPSEKPEKIAHEWEQSTVEAKQCISRLTVENQVVFDPMMGSATTGIAALKLNRNFVGIEIDEEHFKTAQLRIARELKEAAANS